MRIFAFSLLFFSFFLLVSFIFKNCSRHKMYEKIAFVCLLLWRRAICSKRNSAQLLRKYHNILTARLTITLPTDQSSKTGKCPTVSFFVNYLFFVVKKCSCFFLFLFFFFWGGCYFSYKGIALGFVCEQKPVYFFSFGEKSFFKRNSSPNHQIHLRK